MLLRFDKEHAECVVSSIPTNTEVSKGGMGVALVTADPSFGFACLMFVQRFVSRVLVGVLSAMVFRRMAKTRAPLYVQGMVTGFSAAFLNTLFFMSLLVLLFGHTELIQNQMAGRSVLVYIVASVGINAVVEMAVAALVTGAAGTALKKARLRRILLRAHIG